MLEIILVQGLEAVRVMEWVDRRAQRPARRVTETALARLQQGFPFSIVG